MGRITAEPLFASYSVPEALLAAMDGIAARSEDTIGAHEQNPVRLKSAKNSTYPAMYLEDGLRMARG